MTTARIIVKKMLQKAGIITKNEAPAPDEISDGLDALNDMIASWTNDSLVCTSYIRESFSLNAAHEYTIGPGQDFDTTRPLQIIAATIRWDNTDYPLSIIPETMYEKYIAVKTTQGLPQFISYDGAFPVGRIRLYPAPLSGYTLRLMSEKPIGELGLDDEVNLAPGWNRALIYNGAQEICAEYGQDVPAEVSRIARISLNAIKRAVARNRSMDANPAGPVGIGNILNGWWV